MASIMPQTVSHMKASGEITSKRGSELKHIQTAKYTKECGKMELDTVKERASGQTVKNT